MKRLVQLFILLILVVGPLASQNQMVYVKGGTFKMGDSSQKDAPVHTVTVSSFYMSKDKITIEEWMDNIGIYPTGYEENYNGTRVPQLLWKTTAAANIAW